jgi:hypothetical protein
MRETKIDRIEMPLLYYRLYEIIVNFFKLSGQGMILSSCLRILITVLSTRA